MALAGLLALAALGVTIGIVSARASAASNFTLQVDRPYLGKNAIVYVRVRCPSSESHCSGAVIVFTTGDGKSQNQQLRDGMLVAPASQFSLRRNQAKTIPVLVPTSEVKLLRTVRTVSFVAYAIAGNQDTKLTGSFLVVGNVNLAQHDRRLYNLHRLKMSLTGLRVKNGKALEMVFHCSGFSSQAAKSPQGGCQGLIEVYGGTQSTTTSSSPPKLVLIGAQLAVVPRGSSTGVLVKLNQRVLRRIKRQPNSYLMAYAIGVDHVDKLSAAALTTLQLH